MSLADPPYPSSRRAWTAVLILFATAVLAYTDRQVMSLLVDPIRHDLHVDDTGMSLLLGLAFAMVYGVAGLPLGVLADRMSRRNLLAAGVAVWSVGTLMCGLAPSFAVLFAARIVVGLGEAVLSPAAISLISDGFPPRQWGAAVGVYFTGIAIGIGGAILIGGEVLAAVRGTAAGAGAPARSPRRLSRASWFSPPGTASRGPLRLRALGPMGDSRPSTLWQVLHWFTLGTP